MDPTTQRLMMTASAGAEAVNWTDHSFHLRNDINVTGLRDIIYANNLATPLYIAVGFRGTIATSPDGVTWTYNTAVASAMGTNNFYKIGYDSATNRMIAAGSSGIYYYSTDGLTWTGYTQGSATWFGCRFINGEFFLVGAGGAMARSTTGASGTWTTVTSGTTYDIYDIAWGVVSSTSRYMYVGDGSITYQSTNGTTWTAVTGYTASTSRERIAYVGYNSGSFLIVGYNTTGGAVHRSTTGTSVAAVTLPGSPSVLAGLNYDASSPTPYTVLGSGSQALYQSSDSVTWTQVTSYRGAALQLLYSPVLSKYLYVGQTSYSASSPYPTLSYSSSFIGESNNSLTTFTPIKFGWPFFSVAYNPSIGRFLATGVTVYAYSDDGVTWTAGYLPESFFGMIYAGGSVDKYIGAAFSTVYRSSDGITWTVASSPPAGAQMGQMAFSSTDGIIGVSRSTVPTSNVYRSIDGGDTWTTVSTGISNALKTITYSADLDLFLTAGTSGDNKYSPDGTAGTWTAGLDIGGGTPVLYGSTPYNVSTSRILVVGSDATLYSSSTPSSSWSGNSLPTAQTCLSVGVSAKKTVVITGNNGTIISGKALNNLLLRTSGSTQPLTASAFSDTKCAVVGLLGTILVSP